MQGINEWKTKLARFDVQPHYVFVLPLTANGTHATLSPHPTHLPPPPLLRHSLTRPTRAEEACPHPPSASSGPIAFLLKMFHWLRSFACSFFLSLYSGKILMSLQGPSWSNYVEQLLSFTRPPVSGENTDLPGKQNSPTFDKTLNTHATKQWQRRWRLNRPTVSVAAALQGITPFYFCCAPARLTTKHRTSAVKEQGGRGSMLFCPLHLHVFNNQSQQKRRILLLLSA